jgi:hypothetical protein
MILLETKQALLKDGMTELYKNDKQTKNHTQINIIKKQNVSRTCSFKILEGI